MRGECSSLKQCSRCKSSKPVIEFSKARTTVDGYAGQCKQCKTEYTRNHQRTIAGRASAIRGFQVASSKQRGHSPPAYTKSELMDWLIENGIAALMKPWKESNYSKDLAPSVDRIDDSKGYSFDNIRLVTWAENRDKLYKHRKSCERITKQNRKVLQMTLNDEPIQTFDSISAAARATNIQRTNINACCTGRDHQAGGFHWKHI